VNIPIEFEPPPTQAITRWGRRPGSGLVADHPLQIPHQGRIWRWAHARSNDVVSTRDIAHPVANSCRDRLLERACTGLDGLDSRAEQAHALDVGLLAAHVLGAHVDDALQIEQRAGGGGGHAVLARPRLGDDPPLAHALGEQGLTQRVVDLVRTSVVEVLALEIDLVARRLAEAGGTVQRRGTPDVVAQQRAQLSLKLRILARG
jgi:hypothetical protein